MENLLHSDWANVEVQWQLAFIRPGLGWATMDWFSRMSLEIDPGQFDQDDKL